MLLSGFRIRDPFVVPLPAEGRYLLYGSVGAGPDGRWTGLPVYESHDLIHWTGPRAAFTPPAGFWSDRDFWAPEVHPYRGRWYMLATFKAEGLCRGTQILAADRPEGPFAPIGPEPATPRDWECLDGTLWIEPDGRPWMVFCHEWLQVADGEICALPLAPDLSGPAGAARLLFRAGGAPGVTPVGHDAGGRAQYVTDGPCLRRAASGRLLMLWSSFGGTGYRLMVASSAGGLEGPWETSPQALFDEDGGHGMLFSDFRGQLHVALHRPNHSELERAVFCPVEERDGLLARSLP